MQRAEVAGGLAVAQNMERKAGERVRSGDLFRQRAHDVLRDREAAVVERFAAALLAGVTVAGIGMQQITRAQGEFLAAAGKTALAALDKAEDVMLVKVGEEGLHDALEAVGFEMQFFIIDRAAVLVFHAHPSLAGPLYHCGGEMACTISSFLQRKMKSKRNNFA